jgi:hypothetical protein
MTFFQVESGPVKIEVFAHTPQIAARSILAYKTNEIIEVSEIGNDNPEEKIYFYKNSLIENNEMRLVV